ncbi:hypothetical protein XAP6164_50003 [Xanthomonas phaseoli pv. phaseoli]|nr:hypothetical protein XAP6164_50003 [Xanthomonas phaseoli pv. phaseoli]
MRYAHTSRSPSLHAVDQSTATDHVGTVTWESHELTDRLFARSQVVQLDGHGPSAVAYYQVNYALPFFSICSGTSHSTCHVRRFKRRDH